MLFAEFEIWDRAFSHRAGSWTPSCTTGPCWSTWWPRTRSASCWRSAPGTPWRATGPPSPGTPSTLPTSTGRSWTTARTVRFSNLFILSHHAKGHIMYFGWAAKQVDKHLWKKISSFMALETNCVRSQQWNTVSVKCIMILHLIKAVVRWGGGKSEALYTFWEKTRERFTYVAYVCLTRTET